MGSFGTIGLRDTERRGIFECSTALDVFHVALLGKLSQTAGEFFNDVFFPAAQAGEVDVRAREVDPPILCVLRFLKQLGDVKQRFGGDAAAIKADTAGVEFRVDESNLHAKVGGKECGGVAAGSATNDGDACFLHVSLGLFRRLVHSFVHEVTFFGIFVECVRGYP
jgi:hypothetical protein